MGENAHCLGAVTNGEDSVGLERDTPAIFVSRQNLFTTAMEELLSLHFGDMVKPLEVTFYGEKAQDVGGPRREFFTLMLKEVLEERNELFQKNEYGPTFYIKQTKGNIQQRFFYATGLLCGLSMLQQGPLACFLEEKQMQRVLSSGRLDGLTMLGFVDLADAVPVIKFLMRPSAQRETTVKDLMRLIKPEFAEAGTSRRSLQELSYRVFVSYLKEVAAGRSDGLCLGSILQFITGSEVEPCLGFMNAPSVAFREDLPGDLPYANTCTCQLTLPLVGIMTSDRRSIFEKYDLAFANAFFGYA